MTSKRYLQTLTWLRRRLESGKTIDDPRYSPRTRQFFQIIKRKLEKARPRVGHVTNIIPIESNDRRIERELWVEDVEIIWGRLHIALGIKVKEI
jgi:hypothetical protein